MNIDEPDYGILFDYMFIENGGSLVGPIMSTRRLKLSWRSC